MYSLKQFMQILEGYAPLEISHEAIRRGDYDNSGVIVDNGGQIEKVLFSLDLSDEAVNKAIEFGADTIVTHHPAIYTPIKSLDINGETGALLKAVRNGMNVISMHLNLDMAKKGIDFYLAEGLGAKEQKILNEFCSCVGYGREFVIDTTAEQVKESAEQVFGSNKMVLYGSGAIKKVASFCGGGASNALSAVEEGLTDAGLIVSSDIPHHVLKGLIECGKAVLIIPHYVSEQYGFNKFYQEISQRLNGEIEMEYFLDKRFM